MKFIDFGLSRSTSERMGSIVQTPHYMAPEMVNRKSSSYPLDVWSFGCILYKLMTLKIPFQGSNLLVITKNIYKTDPLPIITDFYSPELIQAVIRILDKNPVSRLPLSKFQEILISLGPTRHELEKLKMEFAEKDLTLQTVQREINERDRILSE